MSEDLARVRELLNKAPFWFVAGFAAVAFYASILLHIAFLPLSFLYALLLRPMVWMEWEKRGKDVLLVHTDGKHSEQWMARLSPLIGDRAVVLDYSQERQWDGWSLAAQLIRVFGPMTPGALPEHSLPVAIVFQRLQPPRRFFFGRRSKNCEKTFERLRAALAGIDNNAAEKVLT